VFRNVSTKEITSIIQSQKKYSHRYDEIIHTKVLKISANYIYSPLSYMCNKSILTGIFLDRLKF